MKIAVSASGTDMASQVDPRFGRCQVLMIVDTKTREIIEAFPNKFKDMPGGAGTQAAASLAEKGVQAVLTGNCGPKAMEIFRSENIDVYTGQTGSVLQVIEQFNAEHSTPAESGKKIPKADTRGGRGMCGGGMGGRGRGRGMCGGGMGKKW